MSLLDVIAPHAATTTASVTSFGATLGLAAGALPVPTGLPSWLPYVVSVMGPALVFLLNRLLAAAAANRRSLAASKARRAKELLTDKDPANDAEGRKLEDDAEQLEATADALDAAKK